MSDWSIPLSDLDYGAAEQEAVAAVLSKKWLSMGPETEAFEDEFAASIGSKHAIAVANGTAALHLSFLAFGLTSGDEVIQPALSFVAASNMTVATGATPIFADILALDEPTIDPLEIERNITPRTRAVVAMHYGGYFPRMAQILDICRQHNLPLIEDACHAVGARFLDPDLRPPHGRMAGNLGDIGCFSFFSNKNMAVGEGGMITTNRDDLAKRIRLLRSHGMTTLTWDRHRGHAHSYDVLATGYNYRLDEIRAALGRVQLRKLRQNNERRRFLVSAYRSELSGLPGCTLPFGDYHGDSSYHLAVLVTPGPEPRSRLVQALTESRIQTSLHYPVIPCFKAFDTFQSTRVDRSVLFARGAITLPLYPALTTVGVGRVCEIIRQNLQAL